MNYSAFSGYWFIDAASAGERAALFASWGLLTTAPTPAAPSFIQKVHNWFWEFFT